MFKKSKKYTISLLLSTAIFGSATASADRIDQLWGAVVGGIVGSVVIHAGYETRCSRDIYRPQIRDDFPEVYPPRYRYDRDRRNLSSLRKAYAEKRSRSDYRFPKVLSRKKAQTLKKTQKQKHVPKVLPLLKKYSSTQKIQRALQGLGLYQGTLDGELRSYETERALKKFYSRYEMAGGEVMEHTVKQALISLGELFLFDRALIDRSHTATSQIIQLQTALKIHGFYRDAIDGIMGSRTRKAIEAYQKANGAEEGLYLDLESKYTLVKTAKQKNAAAIDRVRSSFQEKQKPYVDNTLRMQGRG